MKLLYLHNSIYNEHKANFVGVLSMCNAFSELGIDTTLALLDSGISKDNIVQSVKNRYGLTCSMQIEFIPSVKSNVRMSRYLSCFTAKKLIKDLRTQICYVRDPFLLTGCMSVGADTIFESHNACLSYRAPLLDRIWKKKLVRSSEKANFLKLITISEALRGFWLREGVSEEKAVSLHDGFNAHLFNTPLTQKEARKKLGLNADKKIVVYTGSLYRDRQIENILDLAGRSDQAQFILIGGPEEEKTYYQEMAARRKISNIEFIGVVEHKLIPEYLYAADVLLAIWSKNVPTINYCSPLKIFEYMASGRIIVAHGFPTIREVLTHGETALLVDPDSQEDLFEKIQMALSLGYPSKIAAKARTMAFQDYTWKLRAEKILESIGCQ